MMFHRFTRKTVFLVLSLLVLLVFALSTLVFKTTAFAASAVTINGGTTFQTIDGFGFSEAFGQASNVENAPASTQQQVLDLLFNTSTGAGFTILRNIIPSDSNHTIEPNSPGSPSATPTYTWDGNNWGQVALSKQAMSYGVSRIYADAWSAPGFMKTNGSESNGGTLCGAPGASTCSTGDWRKAYANYIVQYIKDYASSGVTISHVGFVNEPSFNASYSSMIMSGAQSADFIKILGPTLSSAGLSTKIVCCDSEGWNLASGDVSAIVNDSSALAFVNNFSSHGYTAAPASPISTGGKPIWETEWSTFDSLDNAWDDGSDASGFTWAQHIYTGLTSANLSAFLYWWGAIGSSTTDNEGLLQINGSSVSVSARLWAMANYSRFVRPGAVRIGATSGDNNLQVSAYKNSNGSVSIVALNSSSSAVTASYALSGTGVADGTTVTPYLTNGSNNTAAQTSTSVNGGSFSATIPARSLVTYVLSGTGGGVTPTPTTGTTPTPTPTTGTTPTPTPTIGTTPTVITGASCNVHYAITNQWIPGFGAAFTITNTGSTAINGWSLKFSFPNGQTITQLWNGTYTQSGSAVTITNVSYNGSIPAGGTVSSEPGFNGTWSGTNSPPTAFTLNGVACTVA
ncbi:MAG TPA: cellulose binding domain-containing protein [Ktedonobacteraceae bacterium]